MTSSSDLFALQEIDLRRDARRAMIADIEARLGETAEVVGAREAVVAAETNLKALQAQQRRLDAKLEDLDAKMRPLETRMYNGSVRNPKELTDMQKELNHFKAQRSELDDDGLEMMEAIEAATGTLKQRQEALKRAEAEWRADQEDLVEDKGEAEVEFASLESERGLRTADMDRSMLGLYESLRSTKAGRAVARVERGTCQGCRITLPTHLVQQVRNGGVLAQCPSCERILVTG
ncbi:MAG TPA: C4-type zinc ribbon domain-containing protein [Dehalococcoidia bacterium]|nr:C4-type zinc ribbon domain-containing protein [Dehalococcoidia bacterium]